MVNFSIEINDSGRKKVDEVNPMDRMHCERWRMGVPRRHIGYIRFIVEAYEGVAQMYSAPNRDEITWIVPASQVHTAKKLLAGLQAELPIQRIDNNVAAP